jgi:hypothetical protein
LQVLKSKGRVLDIIYLNHIILEIFGLVLLVIYSTTANFWMREL